MSGQNEAVRTLDRDSAVPLYAQFETILRDNISSGRWAPGERIPSENQLNRSYGLSRMTARGVLNTLVREGVLFRVPGKGTFVAQDKIDTVSPAYRGIREQLELLGYETTTVLRSSRRELPPREVQERLGIGPEDEVYTLRRVRSARGVPVSVHHSYVPADLAPGLDERDTVNQQLCHVLERDYGLRMKHVSERLESTTLDPEEARDLGIGAGSPALLLRDVISNESGTVFEYSSIVFRGDRVRLHFDYEL